MFHEIPECVRQTMQALEAQDAANHSFSKAVPREVGRFLALLAATAPRCADQPEIWLELGTGCGYSALWLALACRLRGARLCTVDRDAEKLSLARENFAQARVDDVVQVVQDDALSELCRHRDLGFCFIDASGGVGTYEQVVTRMRPGGVFIYDLVRNNRQRPGSPLAVALDDPRVDAVCVPFGGEAERVELVCRRCVS